MRSGRGTLGSCACWPPRRRMRTSTMAGIAVWRFGSHFCGASEMAGLLHDLEAGLHGIAGRVRRQGGVAAAAAGHSAAAGPVAAAAQQVAAWIGGLGNRVGRLGGWLDELAYQTAALRIQAITYLAGLAGTPATDMALTAAGPAAWLEFLITEMEIARAVLGTGYGRVLSVVARGTAAQVISQELL